MHRNYVIRIGGDALAGIFCIAYFVGDGIGGGS